MIRVLAAAAVVLAAAVAGCTPAPSPAPPPTGTVPTAGITRAVPTPPAPLASATARASLISPVAEPDRTLTPGAAGSSLAEICPDVAAALEAARPSTAVKAKVYAEYGIPAAQRHLYRVDHDIPLGLDGQNVMANLWPQPYAQSLKKDRVEDALHNWVCAVSGQAAQERLARAQAAIADRWTTAETVLGISA